MAPVGQPCVRREQLPSLIQRSKLCGSAEPAGDVRGGLLCTNTGLAGVLTDLGCVVQATQLLGILIMLHRLDKQGHLDKLTSCRQSG